MKARSDYNYRHLIDAKIIMIVDLNKGNTSVTNDIENVVEDICVKRFNTFIPPAGWRVIYKDSEGIWSEYSPNDYTFDPISPTFANELINELYFRLNAIV